MEVSFKIEARQESEAMLRGAILPQPKQWWREQRAEDENSRKVGE